MPTELFDLAKSLRVSGLIGFLIGMGAVIWVYPKTPGGMFLIVLVCVALATIIGWVVRRILSWKRWRVVIDKDRS